MKFKLIYGHHWNFGLAVEDSLMMLKYALEKLGHTADIERDFCPGEINIVQEYFTDQYVKEINAAASKGIKFIIIATEIITGDSFNQFEMEKKIDQRYQDPLLNSTYWKERIKRVEFWENRYRNFLEIEKYSLATWHVFEGAVDEYKKALGHDRVFYLPHGFLDKMNKVTHRDDQHKDIDILFTGMISEYRNEVLEKLKAKGLNVHCSHRLTPPFHRNDLIARSKIAVHMKHYEGWPYPSPTRLYYHLVNNSLIVNENTDFTCDIQKYVENTDDVAERCIQIIEDGNYSALAHENLERFKTEQKMEDIVAQLLEKTM